MLISGNNKVKYTYDHMGRITEVDLNDTEDYVKVTYTKDPQGNDVTKTIMKDGTKTITIRDTAGNIISTSIGENEMAYSYCEDNTVSFTGENSFVSYKYTNDNLIEFVTDSVEGCDNVVTKYEYNNDRAVSKISTHSGVGVSASDESTLTDDNRKYKEDYEYDANKMLSTKSITADNSTRTYSYTYKTTLNKALDHITVDGYKVSPKTDPLGRNTGKTIAVGENKIAEEQISYLKFGDHATSLPSAMRFGNKENGNYVLKDSLKYKYDCMGNIVDACENGIPVSSYEYNFLGRIIIYFNNLFFNFKKTKKTSKLTFFIDFLNIL